MVLLLKCILMIHNSITSHIFMHFMVTTKAVVAVDGDLLAGSIPAKQLKIIIGWLAIHEEEVYKAWNNAVRGEHFDKINPL